MKFRYLTFLLIIACSLMGYEGRVWLTTDAVNSKNLVAEQWADLSDFIRLSLVDGPLPNSMGLRSSEQSLYFKGNLNVSIASKGTFMVWLQSLEPMLTGATQTEKIFPIAEINDLFSFDLVKMKNVIDFRFSWENKTSKLNDMHILLPNIEAAKWMHFAFVWDTEQNIFNCYLNGTPYTEEGKPVIGLDNTGGLGLKMYVSEIAIGDCRVLDKALNKTSINNYITEANKQKFDAMLGIRQTIKLTTDHIFEDLHIDKQLYYHSPLNSPAAVRGWVAEGPAVMNFAKDGLIIESADKDLDPQSGSLTFWCWKDLPEYFLAEWNVQILSEYGACLSVFGAKGENGMDVYDSSVAFRTGASEDYSAGDVNCYSLSYYSDMPFGVTRNASYLRLNKGGYLVASGPSAIDNKSNGLHKISLLRLAGNIVLAVDNWIVLDYKEDPQRFNQTLRDGKIALRQFKWTKAKYSDFNIYTFKPKE